MITYQMKVRNGTGMLKTVYVTADNFHDAVKKVKDEHGKDWIVYESSILSAN